MSNPHMYRQGRGDPCPATYRELPFSYAFSCCAKSPRAFSSVQYSKGTNCPCKNSGCGMSRGGEGNALLTLRGGQEMNQVSFLPIVIGVGMLSQALVIFGIFGLHRWCEPSRWFESPYEETWDDGRREGDTSLYPDLEPPPQHFRR